MQKRAPTLANLLVIVTFVLACFSLLLFLWASFGGPVPLKPKGYRFEIAFPNGLQLAEQSDVRISGVPVGRVVSVKEELAGEALATLEVDSRYAPVRADMTARLREKTLLGETYVQLVPHGNSGPYVPDEGRLPNRQVEPTVTLDQVLSAFNPQTRQLFRQWQQTWASSFKGRGEDINSFFSALEPFILGTDRLVTLLNSQEQAVTALIHNTGVVFNALAGRDHQLEGLVVNGEHTFHAAAEASQAFAAAFRALPGFEASSATALRAIDSFQADANPYLDQFRKTEVQLAPTLQQLERFAPPLRSFLTDVGHWAAASQKGLPAFDRSLALTSPLLRELTPILRNINPFLQYLGAYEPELQAFFANATAATNAHFTNENVSGRVLQRYIRAMNILSPEGLAVFANTIGVSRTNPYFHPGASSLLASGLPVFSTTGCSNATPALTVAAGEEPSELIRALRGEPFTIVNERGEKEAVTLSPLANKTGAEANHVGAPACSQQEPFSLSGFTGQFPHVTSEP